MTSLRVRELSELERHQASFIFQQLARAIVRIDIEDGIAVGTGFFVGSEGYLATAYHCIRQGIAFGPNFNIELTFSDGKRHKAKAQFQSHLSNPQADWAVIQLDIDGHECVPITSTAGVQIYDPILAPGYTGSGESPERELSDCAGYLITAPKGTTSTFQIHEANRGKGHSGSPIYHIGKRAVIGISSARHRGSALGDAVSLTRAPSAMHQLQKTERTICQSATERSFQNRTCCDIGRASRDRRYSSGFSRR